MGFVTGIATFGLWLALLFVGVMIGLVIWYAIRTSGQGDDDAEKHDSHGGAPTAESHG